MNALFNPLFFGHVLKWYLEDPTKLRRMNSEELRRFQNHAFKAMLTYAYTVPVYHEKYTALDIHPHDIRGLQDIKKLPSITKEELRRNFPTNVVPSTFQTKKAIVAATSGTTGRSLSLYTDLSTVIRSMLGFRRALLEHHIPWQKIRMSLLLDLSENSFENEYFIHSTFQPQNEFFQRSIFRFSIYSAPLLTSSKRSIILNPRLSLDIPSCSFNLPL